MPVGPWTRTPRQGAQPVEDARGQLDLLPAERRPVERGEPGGGGTHADHRADRGRAGLEAVRRRGVGRALDLDPPDHLAAAQERRQLGQQLLAAPQGAGAGGAEHLVGREGVEVAAQGPDVERPVRRALGAVQDQERPHRVGGLAQAADLGHGPGDVGGVGDGDDAGAGCDQALQAVVGEPALLGDRDRAHAGTGALGHHLPGHDVAVMLELRDQDLVARPQA